MRHRENVTLFTIAASWVVFLYSGGTADTFVTSLFVTMGMLGAYGVIGLIERVLE
jgi:hypothetical protein